MSLNGPQCGFDNVRHEPTRLVGNSLLNQPLETKIKFVNATTISVKVNGSVEEFTFGSNDGSFRTGLLDALNSLGGITASYTTDGRLSLEASDGATLTIADIRKAPLAKLGLTEGTTNAEVIGYRQVQIGTE